MAKLTPDIDNFTKGINETIPSKTENLSPKLRQSVISDSIAAVKGDICNKIDGAMNLITGLKTGANNLFGKIKDFDIDSFFEGPLQKINDKITDVIDDFNKSLDNFKNQEFNLSESIQGQLDKLEDEIIERVESVKIAAKGFANTLNDIKDFSNKTIRDINFNPDIKGTLQSLKCKQAEEDIVDNALKQKSSIQLAGEQEKIVENSNKLIKVEDSISNYVEPSTLPEFIDDSTSKWWSGDRDSLEKLIDPDTGEILGYRDPSTGDFLDTDFNIL